MLRIAIIADDLTGALDTAEPFSRAGAAVSIATSPEAAQLLPFDQVDVVSINADTRRHAPVDAAATIDQVWRDIAAWQPDILLKKIDSRLKGNVAAELRALLAVSGRTEVLAAPAIPAMGRVTRGGKVTGFGIDRPISFQQIPGWRSEWAVADCSSVTEMNEIARKTIAAGTALIAVGASGLAAGLAELLPISHKSYPASPNPSHARCRMMMAIGSRDPITLAQIDALSQSDICFAIPETDKPLSDNRSASLILLRPDHSRGDPDAIASELAQRALQVAMTEDISAILLSGGDTAGAFIQAAGIQLLMPSGSLADGMPIAIGNGAGRDFTLITKSGGFGHPRTLIEAVQTWQG